MSSPYPQSLDRVIRSLSRLPGIGKRSAERMAFHLLRAPPDEVQDLASAIGELQQATRLCPVTFNLCEGERCSIYDDPSRDRSKVLVIEHPSDLINLEATGNFDGVYHVLWGRLSPLEGVGPGDLTVEALLDRVRATDSPVREVILGTNPTLEGDGTALYLAEQLGRYGVRVTRLARGLPTGFELDRASKAVLIDALHGRRDMGGADSSEPTFGPDKNGADPPPSPRGSTRQAGSASASSPANPARSSSGQDLSSGVGHSEGGDSQAAGPPGAGEPDRSAPTPPDRRSKQESAS